VSAEAPPKNFPALSGMLEGIVRSFEYEPLPLPVPRGGGRHVRRATVLVQTARGSGSGVVPVAAGRRGSSNAHVVRDVAANGLVLATFTDEPDPSPHEGKLAARDEAADLALLEVAASQPGVTRLQLRRDGACRASDLRLWLSSAPTWEWRPPRRR
jgi:S1-C subfamily serine protease